jgi:hypothetical protein
VERGNSDPSSSLGRLTARQADDGLDWDAEKSECLAVMAGISDVTFSTPQGGLLSAGLWSRGI